MCFSSEMLLLTSGVAIRLSRDIKRIGTSEFSVSQSRFHRQTSSPLCPPIREISAFRSNIRPRLACMRTSRKTDFRWNKDFRSSKNNFRGHDISQGLDWEPPSLSPHFLLYRPIIFIRLQVNVPRTIGILRDVLRLRTIGIAPTFPNG